MSKFVLQSEMTTDHVDWGSIGWRTRPENTSCKTFVVMDVGLEPGFGRYRGQHLHAADVETLLEVATEQPLHDRVLALLPVGFPNQAMREASVGRALHAVESERDAFAGAFLRHACIQRPPFLHGTELGAPVIGARDALFRHVGV